MLWFGRWCVRFGAAARCGGALRYYEDLSEAETADVLDCAVGTVKSQAHHALQALRRGLVNVPASARR